MSTPFDTRQVLSAFPIDDLPIVSVGCGMCEREYKMSKTRNIICVDPTHANVDPWSEAKKKMKPDYENVKELVQAKPSIIGNCHLFIEYPMTDYVTYDFLAIYDLQPKSLVILTTSTPASGGLLLHMWLNNNGIKTTNKEKTIKSIKKTLNITLHPNAMKYDLRLRNITLRSHRDGEICRFILVSGTRRDDKIIKRPLLSPAHMEHMGFSNASKTTHMKSILIMNLINKSTLTNV